jgi:2',3'-cyclic-nucleotide 2'-phosphodiesterase (5'-nucleotidase family)
MNKLYILLISIFIISCSHSGGGNSGADISACGSLSISSGDIAIIYTNDVHCGVTPIEYEGTITNIGYAGVSAFADCVAAITGENNVTLVDAGDSVQGEAIGTLSDGEYIVDIMNKVGYDIVVPGNHEFDYGMEQMRSLMQTHNATVISANFKDLRSNQHVYQPYTVVQYGDRAVAFVGVTTPETIFASSPAYFQDDDGNFIYSFSQEDLYNTVQAAVDAAALEADYVIVIGHFGTDASSIPYRSIDLINNTRGIDVFIDGHSHSTIEAERVQNLDGKEVLLTQTGTKLAGAGLLTISLDGVISTRLLADFSEVDEEVEAFIDDIMADFEADLAEVVATSAVDLVDSDPIDGKRIIRSQETNLGDFVADAYRIMLGADIGFINGGGIRAAIAAGEITYGELIAVHPFNNSIVVVEATGREILDALELSARAVPGENGAFLQV